MSSGPDKTDSGDDLIAHKTDDGRKQLLAEHLRNVAERAGKSAVAFDAQNWARAAALLHDDGKALDLFQKGIRGAPMQVHHSTPGVEYAAKRMAAPRGFGKLLAYCIAGHHTGLPDGNAGGDDTCLVRRLARAHTGPGYLAAELPSSFEGPPIPKAAAAQRGFAGSFFVRMVFSCLVDADFMDTEDFFRPEKTEKRGSQLSLEQL